MSPGVRRWSGAEEATGCRLLASPPYLLRQDKRDPVAVVGGSCGAAPSCGRDRRYRPDRPLSRVLHLHQACMDHPLEVARQRLQVDGKPHPTAPSHAQAPKPVGALQLGVRSLDPGPYVIPLAPSGAARCSPSVRLEDVGARRSSFTGQRAQGAGLACCPGKVASTRSGASFSSHSSMDWPAGHT